ncbi:MAG: hypothetical protein GY929_27355 [Actinomycetia bacterium]|nr:hypothetical protein [Actinomycetes bacterium]
MELNHPAAAGDPINPLLNRIDRALQEVQRPLVRATEVRVHESDWFGELVGDVIRPILELGAWEVEYHGHAASVEEAEDLREVRLHVAASGHHWDDSAGFWLGIAPAAGGAVAFVEWGPNGPRLLATIPADQVDEEAVLAQIVPLIEDLAHNINDEE